MTVREEVSKIMDDFEPRTAREISQIIKPDARDYELNILIPQVRSALLICVKWGEMKKVGESEEGYRAIIYQKVRA